MNIWLPIITNLIIALIITAGVFVGKNNGWKIELGKLFFSCGAAVGAYFLAPVITNALISIDGIAQIANTVNLGIVALNSLMVTASFLIFYGLISLTALIIKINVDRIKHKGMNIAKVKRARGIDRKTDRALRKQEKKLAKMQKELKKQSKVSKAFGIIFGIILSIIVAFSIVLPTKYIFKGIANEQPNLQEIEKGYEYTPIGQLDKVTGLNDFISRGE